MDLKGKKVAVLGYGLEGKSLASFLLRQKAEVTICDKISNLKSQISKLGLESHLGKDYLKNLTDFEIVFRSPGIPYKTKEIQSALKKGVQVSSATCLFFDLCKGKIIGITGTKGKGTTAALVYAMLKESGKRVFLGGNIGKPMMDFVEKVKPSDWVVLELSSFQLQDLKSSPHIAVILDIKEDHLDYHRTFNEYVQAKKNIVHFQKKEDFAVICADYFTSFEFAAETKAGVFYFSRHKAVDQGCFVRWSKILKGGSWVGEIILITTPTLRRGSVLRSPELVEGRRQKIQEQEFPIAKTYDIQLRGLHNLENICAAVLASYLAGAKIAKISEVATHFKGIPHRLEKVAQINGISFFNDSASTNPSTTIAAISSFSEPLILIVGGSEKKADFAALAEKIGQSNVKIVFLIGQTAPAIENCLNLKLKRQKAKSQLKIKNLNFSPMDKIVRTAFQLAKPGDVVLLSPACASFDMFKNYQERGNCFKKEVLKILKKGQSAKKRKN